MRRKLEPEPFDKLVEVVLPGVPPRQGRLGRGVVNEEQNLPLRPAAVQRCLGDVAWCFLLTLQMLRLAHLLFANRSPARARKSGLVFGMGLPAKQ